MDTRSSQRVRPEPGLNRRAIPEPGLTTSQLPNPASCRSLGAKIAASCAKGAADDPLTTSSAKIPVLSGDNPRASPRALAVGCRAAE